MKILLKSAFPPKNHLKSFENSQNTAHSRRRIRKRNGTVVAERKHAHLSEEEIAECARASSVANALLQVG